LKTSYKNTDKFPYTVYELAQYMAIKVIEYEEDEFKDDINDSTNDNENDISNNSEQNINKLETDQIYIESR